MTATSAGLQPRGEVSSGPVRNPTLDKPTQSADRVSLDAPDRSLVLGGQR